MRIIAVTNQFPLPLDAGGPIRFHGLCRALARVHEVHLLALARPDTTDELAEELRTELGGPVEVFQPSAVPGFWTRWTKALRTGMPTYVRAQYSQGLAEHLAALLPECDAVVFLDDYAAGYAQVVGKSRPAVLDKSNVLGWSIAAAPAGGGLRERLRRPLATHLIRRFERSSLRDLAAVIVTSEEESDRLERVYGRRADAVVPSAVDLPDAVTAPNGARAVGWLGDHRYAPNVEGLVRFIEEGWEPLGREGWRLLVAGRNPPPEVRELEGVPGVQLLGFVERLDDLFAQISAGLVPLWRGAGVKLKTLAFMGAGVPVVATPVALEGVSAEDSRHCLIAEDAPGLAAALRKLDAEQALSASLGREGRRLVAEAYTWETVGPRFVRAVEEAVSPSTRS
jgi:glycosyltransferase involved in cell wall biosynthesis